MRVRQLAAVPGAGERESESAREREAAIQREPESVRAIPAQESVRRVGKLEHERARRSESQREPEKPTAIFWHENAILRRENSGTLGNGEREMAEAEGDQNGRWQRRKTGRKGGERRRRERGREMTLFFFFSF